MEPKRKHFVTFYSPSRYWWAESTTRPIEMWAPTMACEMARLMKQPFAFQFTTNVVADDIPDGEGGALKVVPKEVARSGMYFLGGLLRTYDEVVERAAPNEEVLRFNMRINGYWVVWQINSSHSTTRRFEQSDVVVDPHTGSVIHRGDEPWLVEYRKQQGAKR